MVVMDRFSSSVLLEAVVDVSSCSHSGGAFFKFGFA